MQNFPTFGPARQHPLIQPIKMPQLSLVKPTTLGFTPVLITIKSIPYCWVKIDIHVTSCLMKFIVQLTCWTFSLISFCLIHHLWNLRPTLDGGRAIQAWSDYLQSEVFNKGAHALISCNFTPRSNTFDNNLSVNVNFISLILGNNPSIQSYFIWKFKWNSSPFIDLFL